MVKRSWISEKEMDEFDHITGDQIRAMTDLRKLKKLERYMREEGFPQTAEAAYETIIKLGGQVVRPGDRENNFDHYDEEFEGFLKEFDTWKDNIKGADDKLRQLQRVKIFNTNESDNVLATSRADCQLELLMLQTNAQTRQRSKILPERKTYEAAANITENGTNMLRHARRRTSRMNPCRKTKRSYLLSKTIKKGNLYHRNRKPKENGLLCESERRAIICLRQENSLLH